MTGRDADRQDIHDLCSRYVIALDERDWSALRAVFADDALMAFAMGKGEVSGADAIVDSIATDLQPLEMTQHLIGTVLPRVDGDIAQCTSYFWAQHEKVAGGGQLMISGAYEDELVRTDEGWRITHRTQTVLWRRGDSSVVPAGNTSDK